ncbi:ImmA/IrrE family metallo-endopeptidase [Desulfitobacterium sp.]|uniref:ImmA/IrrE family metallo-endopeptidase n=1 Tax=Desulfitobacterium sp. TaxID=49981 RepID=UPI002B9FD7BC|nr:ImmA/IrrE family metallo-endopeptidase [Desulfitobacterium sp.]HVJ50257.1 ImmA/IrrE family metallo-endopeptidase [Desulfitobacterium sp.]
MDKLDLWKKATSLRKYLGEDAQSPLDIFALAHSLDDLTLVFYPMGDRLSGMCIKNPKSNVIAINSAMSLGRQRFSMAHELFHLFYDPKMATTICAQKIGSGQPIEKEADQFASYILMPPNTLTEAIQKNKKDTNAKLTVENVVKLEQFFGISRQAILIRLIEEKELTDRESDSMRRNVIRSARCLGYDDALYRPLPPEKQFMTYGHYIQQTEKILERELVSEGKYEELLLDAFRSDLVYGDISEGGELVD